MLKSTRTMLRILKYLKPYTWPLVALIVLVFIQVATNLQLPNYMANIVNKGIVINDSHYIITTGGIMLLISLVSAAAAIGVGYLASRIATAFAMDIRKLVFTKVESFSLTEFNTFSTASLLTRTTNDIQQIQTVLIMILRLVVMAPITGVWAIIKAYQLAPSMSWIIALAVVVLVSIIIALFSVALPKFQILQKLVDKLNLVTRQNLTGLRVIRAFNSEKFEESKFEIANQNLTDVNLYVNRLMVILQPAMTLVLSLASIAIVWVGAHYIGNGTLEIGNMLAFMQYAMQVIFAFLMVSIMFIMVPRASVSAQRVNEVIETEPVIHDPTNPVTPDRQHKGVVEFKNVTFSYPGAEAALLQDISFTAQPGQTTAFIGSTGSGKSTLVNLIPRLYDVTGGAVLVDGVDIRQMRQEDLWRKIGYVPQKGVLFSGTIQSNITYGAPRASQSEVAKAAQISQATEFITELDGQYDAPIAQGGANVSGGQKQRLSIARAIARDPEIYIFDDSFSALDLKTDSLLRQALKAETKHKTVLIVAQRISTIIDADRIIVLNEGAIVGSGTHQELIKNNAVYQEIARSQLSDEELKTYQLNDSSTHQQPNLAGKAT